jgi:hypothetical protein
LDAVHGKAVLSLSDFSAESSGKALVAVHGKEVLSLSDFSA